MTSVFKKNFWKILLGVLFIVVVFVVWFMQSNAKRSETWVELKKTSIMEAVYGIGTVTANRSLQFKSGVPSSVQNIFVREGDLVKKGQSLFELGEAPIFKAPFDGTVTWLPVKVGESVFTQAVILQLTDLKDRYMVVSLEQSGAMRVRKNQNVKISFDNLRDQVFLGSVDSIYSGNGGSFLVRITVKDLPDTILPGMAGDVGIEIKEHQSVFVVPIQAIEESRIKLKDAKGKTKEVEVKTSISDATQVMIESSELQEGEWVLIPAKKKS